MESPGSLYIKINGEVNGEPLTPRNYDVREIMDMLPIALDLLFGADKKSRPQVAYSLEEGSVKHIFITALQVTLSAASALERAQEMGTLHDIDPVRAQAVEKLQSLAIRKARTYEVGANSTSIRPLTITPATSFKAPVIIRHWYETEVYLYGQLVDMGGAQKSNIHLLTEDRGIITLPCNKEYVESIDYNPVYKMCSIRAVGKQDALTDEIDYDSLKVIEIRPHNRSFYNSDYIDSLSRQATENWLGEISDPDKWLKELRGYDD